MASRHHGVQTLSSGIVCLLLCLAVTAQRSTDFRFVIPEEQETGSLVGNVKETAGLDTQYPSDIASQLQFQFLNTPKTNLMIENSTGIIRTSGRIDRDEICALMKLCRVDLDIAVQPIHFFRIIKITVQIQDINDNWPHFADAEITHAMLESTSPGSSFIVPAAMDPDGPGFGIKGYRLIPSSSTFQLQKKNKLDGSTEVRIFLRDRLDRESKNHYTFQIVAYDGDNPAKTGSMNLDIIVQDVNDNAPVFDNATYTVTVLENLDTRTTITQVHATDPDVGSNSRVLYGFSHQTSKMYGHLFGIDNTTGEIFVRALLDHEQGSVYHLVVQAVDGGQDSLTADTTVIVHIQDLNDNAPEISVNTLTALGTEIAEVSEEADVGTFVAHISVVDQDSGRNGQVTCSLHDSHFALRKIEKEESKYQIVTADVLDREVVSEFNLALVCRDKGRESQMAFKNIQVKVTDVNDNDPVFTHSGDGYSIEIAENNEEGAILLQVNATDPDAGDNGRIRYKLPKAIENDFEIDRYGAIYARHRLNREEKEIHEFHVIAEDRGSPRRLHSSAKVVIKLVDVNDSPPNFTQPRYDFSVFENGEQGMEVGILTALDPDQFPNNQFTYSFAQPNMYGDRFVIDEHTGRITATKSLDSESQVVYDMTAVAMDTNDHSLSSTVKIMIYVQDQNDNAPVFHFPTAANNTLHISNAIPVGKSVARVEATDADFGDNGEVTYYITKSNAGASFTFDQRAGDLRLNIDITNMHSRVFRFDMEARDKGSPQQTTKTTLKIIVNDTIAYHVADAQTSILSSTNFVIIIIVSSVSFVLIVFLTAAIATVIFRQKRDRRKNETYANHMESMKMLHGRDTVSTFADGLSPNHQHPPGSPSSTCSDPPMADMTLEMEDSEMEGSPKRWGQPPSWPSVPDGHGGHTVVTEMLESPGGCPRRSLASSVNHKDASAAQEPPSMGTVSPGVQRPWVFPQQRHRHLDVQQVVSLDNDVESNQSGDISNADSGRGASEEGDLLSRAVAGDVCPKCHSVIPRGTQSHSAVCPAHGTPNKLPQPPHKRLAAKPPICCPSRFMTLNSGVTHPPLVSRSPYQKPPGRVAYATLRQQDYATPPPHSLSNANGYQGGSRTFPRPQHVPLQTFGHRDNGNRPSGCHGNGSATVESRPEPSGPSSSRSVVV